MYNFNISKVQPLIILKLWEGIFYMNGKNKKQKNYYVPIFIAVGAGIGLLFGLIISDNIAISIPMGAGIGVCIGAIVDMNQKKK